MAELFYVVDVVVLCVPEGVYINFWKKKSWFSLICDHPPPIIPPREYYLVHFCNNINLGFEAHLYTAQT